MTLVQQTKVDGVHAAAVFSECGLYRFSLSRHWGPSLGSRVLFLMLNPSTATAQVPDPTVTRCIRFARAWQFSGVNVANIFALRSTDPGGLLRTDDPVGPTNDEWIVKLASESDQVICAWGSPSFKALRKLVEDRAQHVATLLNGRPLHCLGMAKSGAPRHPLYLRSDARRIRCNK